MVARHLHHILPVRLLLFGISVVVAVATIDIEIVVLFVWEQQQFVWPLVDYIEFVAVAEMHILPVKDLVFKIN